MISIVLRSRVFTQRVAVTLLLFVTTACVQKDGKGDSAAGNTTAAGDSASQLAFGAQLTLTDSGAVRGRLRADSAYMYNNGLLIEMRAVSVLFVDSIDDSLSVLNAKRARYDVAAGRLEASDSVTVSTINGRTLKTSYLLYETATNALRSDSSYTFVVGSRNSNGDGFTSDIGLLSVKRPTPATQ